jgi:hypothetical protein
LVEFQILEQPSEKMINALPSSIANELERLKKAIAQWPIPFPIDQAVKWVLQFDRDDFPLALRVLESIDVLGQRDVRSAFEVAQAKLERAAIEKGTPIKRSNTLYAGVGQAGKSGGVMAYHYRLTAEIPEGDFFGQDEEEDIDFSKIDNVVLLDDVIGTGHSVSTDVARIAAEVHSLSKTRNIYVLTVAGYSEGITRVVEETGASVIAALEYSSKDTVNDLDAAFYSGLPMFERSRTLERIKRYCRIAARSDLGYGNVGGLLVFDHNTPNTSLPLIWARGNGWIPLFPRAGRIQGSAKVLKVVEDERRAEKGADAPEAPKKPERTAIELTLFVEGKFDERFVDVMRSRMKLAERLGVKDISAVALGGLAQSTRLFDLLRESRKYAVFVVEGDKHSKRLASRVAPSENTRVMFLKPSFGAMLDAVKFLDAANISPPVTSSSESSEDQSAKMVEDFLKRSALSANNERLAQIIEEFMDPAKYEAFVQELNIFVDQLLETP